MAAKKKEESLWQVIFKLLFASVLLFAVMNGCFWAGAKTVTEKMFGGVNALCSTRVIQDGSGEK